MPKEESGTTPGQTKPGRRRRRRGSTRRTKCATSATAIKRAELERKVLDLRKEGLSIRAIAPKLKVSKSEAQRLLAAALAGVGATQETKQQVRTLELERLDTWLHGIAKRAARGDEKAIMTALRIEERRAKAVGTDAPVEQRLKLTILGQINWVFDIIAKELGKDAADRVLRRIGEEGGPPADDGGGPG